MMQSLTRFVATIARRVRFELVEESKVRPLPSISLMFDRGLHVVVREVGSTPGNAQLHEPPLAAGK